MRLPNPRVMEQSKRMDLAFQGKTECSSTFETTPQSRFEGLKTAGFYGDAIFLEREVMGQPVSPIEADSSQVTRAVLSPSSSRVHAKSDRQPSHETSARKHSRHRIPNQFGLQFRIPLPNWGRRYVGWIA